MNKQLVKYIHEAEKKSLSNNDILKLCNGQCNVVTYSELPKYRNLDELLGTFDACVLLYQTGVNYGHWCAIIKINPKLVEFFDPYGFFPDSELKFVPQGLRARTHQNFKYLSKLLYESPYQLSFNDDKFQKYASNVNSCGRHSVIRILLKHLPLEQYNELMNSTQFNPDFIVTFLTELIEGNLNKFKL
jgi:hypothetical protein